LRQSIRPCDALPMKITTNTPEMLIVEERPWVIGAMMIVFILAFTGVGLTAISGGDLWGVAFIIIGAGLGLAAFWAFVRRVQVVFHRPQGWVEIRRRSLTSAKKVRHTLDEVESAVVEPRYSDGSTLYRVALQFSKGQSQGRHPLTQHYTNTGNHQGVADAINAWLRQGKGRHRGGR